MGRGVHQAGRAARGLSPGASPRVVLVGMMGSGKTSVGQILSERTGWPYLDNDALLEGASGRTARELAAAGGDELRRAERQALMDALEVPPPAIIGAAAGVVLDPAITALLRGSFVVWLRASPDTLVSRAAGGPHRPWLDADALSWLEEADEARTPGYRAVASLEIQTDQLSPRQVADAIEGALASG
jgi:shikimate kinase